MKLLFALGCFALAAFWMWLIVELPLHAPAGCEEDPSICRVLEESYQ